MITDHLLVISMKVKVKHKHTHGHRKE